MTKRAAMVMAFLLVALTGVAGAAHAASTAPAMRLPFPEGFTAITSGPHTWDGTDDGPRGSVDFGAADGSEQQVVAAAAGRAWVYDDLGWARCYVLIDHGGGWMTAYYHLKNVPADLNGKTVAAGDAVGVMGAIGVDTCGGGTPGYRHVHFVLLKDGAEYPIDGLSIGGYTVHAAPGAYCGSWTRNSDGVTVAESLTLQPPSPTWPGGRCPRIEPGLTNVGSAPAPVADFTASASSGTAPLTVEFTDTSTGNPTSWSWDFGDGSAPVTTQNPTHVYTAAGTFAVSLTAGNATGSDTKTAVGAVAVSAPTVFSDVPPGAAFYDDITWLADQGITRGAAGPGGTLIFGPGDNITREAMSAFLYRFMREPAFTPPTTSPFPDLPYGDPAPAFYKEITWLEAEGIESGGGPFNPALPVTREVMARWVFRALTTDAEAAAYVPSGTEPFTDVDPSHPFYAEISWMWDSGLSTGANVGGQIVYGPGDPIRREAMAAFFHRAEPLRP